MSAKFKDFKFTSQELVLAMVNAANSLRLDLNRVEFVDPVPTSGPTNTQTTMRAKAGGGFEGSFPIKYNRLDFNVLFSAYPILLDPEEYATSDQLLPIINEDYGLKLQPEDIVIESVNVVDDKYVLKASASSVAWFGQTDVTFRLDITAISNFPVTELNGVFMPSFSPFEFTFTVTADKIGVTSFSHSDGDDYNKPGVPYCWGSVTDEMGFDFAYLSIRKDMLVNGVKRDIVTLYYESDVIPKFIEVNGVRSLEFLGGEFDYSYAFENVPTPVVGYTYQFAISSEPADLSQLKCQSFAKHISFAINDMAGTSKALSNFKDVGGSFPAGTIGLNFDGVNNNAWYIVDYLDWTMGFGAFNEVRWIDRIYWQDEAENSIRIDYVFKDTSWSDIPFRQVPAKIKYDNQISQQGTVEYFAIENGQNWRNAVARIRYPIAGTKPTAPGQGIIEFLEEFLTVQR